ncbi:hypothetical protein [Dysgonomonas sp. 25]|uniref:hypothetical protein n=1 Tax=Dysgonomonas sp. 25 TaxID=2302933 RepID=UPI0013D874D6|nr:hypothetical protein [Dysgonomonas sp. 25]NDV69125.1 hypothetical protein [Dysgonomonas sp. 25]
MKLNKLFFILLSVALMAGFASCSSDDDDLSQESIVGAWIETSSEVEYKTSNSTITSLINDFFKENGGVEEGDEEIYKFDVNGTYIKAYGVDDIYPGSGIYTISGSKLTLTDDDGDVNIVTASVSGDKLTFKGSVNIDETVQTYFGSTLLTYLRTKLAEKGQTIDLSTVTLKSVSGKRTFRRTNWEPITKAQLIVGAWTEQYWALEGTTDNETATTILNSYLSELSYQSLDTYTFYSNGRMNSVEYATGLENMTATYRISGDMLYVLPTGESTESPVLIDYLTNYSMSLSATQTQGVSCLSYLTSLGLGSSFISRVAADFTAEGLDISTVQVNESTVTTHFSKAD